MSRALQVGSYLAATLLGMSLLALVVGLGMAARPEMFVAVGGHDVSKTGLAIALVAGIAAMGSALLLRVLRLLGNGEADGG